jgi:hypothetical protein
MKRRSKKDHAIIVMGKRFARKANAQYSIEQKLLNMEYVHPKKVKGGA